MSEQKHSAQTLRGWIERIEAEGHGLSSFDEEFMESMTKKSDKQLENLSSNQLTNLERIYTDKTP